MGSRLGRRVVHFANLPIKLLMPNNFTNITEIALKTIPSASKIEIKRVMESLYGFQVDKVRTLNMEGKKKKRGGLLIAKPDYKKAYVTLKAPLSLSQDLYPIGIVQQDRNQQAVNQSKSAVVEEGDTEKHWLYGNKEWQQQPQSARRGKSSAKGSAVFGEGAAKFPWSNMRFR
ncbi:uncharacterized protein [Pyrus communis]|uniref:uncharacterized protein n=1 Tax=Pyrus communis TaxID=23211 RepID=UPI0035C1D30A